jgi:hypothetical protein
MSGDIPPLCQEIRHRRGYKIRDEFDHFAPGVDQAGPLTRFSKLIGNRHVMHRALPTLKQITANLLPGLLGARDESQPLREADRDCRACHWRLVCRSSRDGWRSCFGRWKIYPYAESKVIGVALNSCSNDQAITHGNCADLVRSRPSGRKFS